MQVCWFPDPPRLVVLLLHFALQLQVSLHRASAVRAPCQPSARWQETRALCIYSEVNKAEQSPAFLCCALPGTYSSPSLEAFEYVSCSHWQHRGRQQVLHPPEYKLMLTSLQPRHWQSSQSHAAKQR